MCKLLILTGFAALALAVAGCEENVQIAGGQALMAAPHVEMKTVYVDGVADYCIVVEEGTDIPVPVSLLRQ